MREDQHAAGARGLGEPERGHGLAGAGGVLEPEAPAGAGILQHGVRGGLLLGLLGRVPVERLLVGELVALELHLARRQLLGGRRAAVPVAALATRDQQLRGERDQRAGERIHLVRGQHGAVHQVRLLLGEHSLQAQDEREVAPPLHRRLGAARVQLGQRRVQGGAACGALRKGGAGVLAFEHERLARELLGATQVLAGYRRGLNHRGSFSHDWAFSSKGNGRAGLSHGGNGSRDDQQGPPFVFTALSSPERGARRVHPERSASPYCGTRAAVCHP